MKRIFLLAAAAATFFTACEKNDYTKSSNEVKFVVNQVVTRVTTSGNVTSFEDNDIIAVTSSGLHEDILNEQYTYTTAGLSGKEVFFNEDTEASFVAHYPSTLENNSGTIVMTVPEEQTAESFHKNMFMVAKASGSPAQPTVNFNFTHQLAWIKIVLTDIAGTAVTVNNVLPTVTWTSESNTASGNAKDILTWKQTESQVYWALVPAQTINNGTKFITITTADKTYEYTLSADLKLNTAKVKTITLSLPEPDAEIVKATFSADAAPETDWTEDEALNGNTEEYVEPALVLISEEDGNFENVDFNADVTGMSSVTYPGWTKLLTSNNGNPRGTIEYFEDENCMNITPALGQGAAWHNLSLIYKTADKVIKPGKYTLSFEYKASAKTYVSGEENKPCQLAIRIMQPEVTPPTANITWGGPSYIQPSSTDNFVLTTREIEIKGEPTSSNSPTTTPSLQKGVLVMFSANAADGTTYSIRNVTLIEKKTE